MGRNREVNDAEYIRLKKYWKEKLIFNEAYEENKELFLEVMQELQDMLDGRKGTLRTVKYYLDLEKSEGKPTRSEPYQEGPGVREIQKEEVNKLKEMNFIEPAQLKWASKIVFAPKKDGQLRLFYRRLNTINIRDYYPVPRNDEYIN